MALSFIPCMALPQVALADDTVSGEATVFTVYTTDNAGNNKQVAKAYTQAELEAPVDSSADAILIDYNAGVDFAFRYTGSGSLTIYTWVDDGALHCEIYLSQ